MEDKHNPMAGLTQKILIGMLLGVAVGALIKYVTFPADIKDFLVGGVLGIGGTVFVTLLKMLVVPVVLISLICGGSKLDAKHMGRVGGKALVFYLLTTMLAISLALLVATLVGVGEGAHLTATQTYSVGDIPTIKKVLLQLFPSNPFKALADGEMLQIILFALLMGAAITLTGKPGKRILSILEDLNHVVMSLVIIVLKITPYGVFCLMGAMIAKEGLELIANLIGYFLTVFFVLMLHLIGSYTLLLRLVGRLNPLRFFKKMYGAMLFAFSVSSSAASIPVVLETVENRLGVKNSIASFVIPLGATMNMDGTAIMQGVATVFIAHAYHVDIGLAGYLTVIGMATLASIGTAAIPSAGLITLTMVLHQLGLPGEGVGLIIGVDRLLDMTRTAVNISGDAMIACLIGKSEKRFDEGVYNDPKL